MGNGTNTPILGQGSTTIPYTSRPYALNHVYHVPHIIKNLISVRKFTVDNNVSIEFDPFGFSVKDLVTGKTLTRCNSTGDLYPLTSTADPVAFHTVSPLIWHNRLGHPGPAVFSVLRQNNLVSSSSHKNCHACFLGKHCRLRFSLSQTVTFSPFDIIHADLWTSPVTSKLGHKYYLVLLDHFSHYIWTFPLQTKSQVFSIFTKFHTYIHTQFEKKIKAFQCDNGREFNNSAFHQFCNAQGIQFRFSCPYTSSQNGKAERILRTINNMIRTSLIQASLPPCY